MSADRAEQAALDRGGKFPSGGPEVLPLFFAFP